jgi:hypothetical protein
MPEPIAQSDNWKYANRLQPGKYAECLAKMEFVLRGCDPFKPQVDHHGIEVGVRKPEAKHYGSITQASLQKSASAF